MVFSDGMVHFLKIDNNFNKSTKTILWLKKITVEPRKEHWYNKTLL